MANIMPLDLYKEKLDKIFKDTNNILENQIERCINVENKLLLKLEEINKLQTEIHENVCKLENKCRESERRKIESEKEYSKVRQDVENAKYQFKFIEEKQISLVNKYEKLEEECVMIQKHMNLTDHDKTVLELDRIKHKIYNELMNVVWDYSKPINDTIIAGYVRNKIKTYINAFEYNTNKMSKEELSEKLWTEIENCAGDEYKKIVEVICSKHSQENKENVQQNVK